MFFYPQVNLLLLLLHCSLRLFPRCTGLLVAVLAADVADGRLTSRTARRSQPLLPPPRQPPQLQVRVGRRAANGQKMNLIFVAGNRAVEPPHAASAYSLQQADLELQPAEDLIEGVRVRQQAVGVRDGGGVGLRVVLLHAREAEHVTRYQQIRF